MIPIAQHLIESNLRRLFWAYAAIVLVCVSAAVGFQMPLLLAIPFGLLVVFQAIVDYSKIFYILLATLPMSMEFNFTPSLGTDLPSEPLTVGLMLVFLAQMLSNSRGLRLLEVAKHPILLALLAHFCWSGIASYLSGMPILSLKWMLAKFWYIVTFVWVALEILRDEKSIKWFYWSYMPILIATILWALVRHGATGFAFEAINPALRPWYRNHVNYAGLLSISLPLLWYAKQWFPKSFWGSLFWLLPILLVFIGVQFSYTRAAYISIILGIGAYWVIRWRLMKITLFTISFFAFIGISYLVYDNNFLKLAPDFQTTVSQENFNDLVAATSAGKDISTMERVNRWVAGGRMVGEKPFFGFGPSCFYTFYKKYSLASFRTYVSVNDEKSTVHCYFLLMAVEQGVPGFLIFTTLIFIFLLQSERIYHQTTDTNRRQIVLIAALSQVIAIGFLLINDMVETDKLGSFFFLNMAILINMDYLNKQEKMVRKRF
ncbi:MAG: hypothetical protein RI894_2212 [Bacteroidota bacterium]|jgi:O-antigen ligase